MFKTKHAFALAQSNDFLSTSKTSKGHIGSTFLYFSAFWTVCIWLLKASLLALKYRFSFLLIAKPYVSPYFVTA
jgi:hypothetical protein